MLSTERSKAAHMLDHENIGMTSKHIILTLQIPPRTETRLVTKGKHTVDRHPRSIAACFHLSLLADERLELRLRRFDFRPLDPAKINQPIQQLPKEVKSRIIVASNDNLKTETAWSLPNWRTRSSCIQDGAHEIFEEATTVPTEFFAEKATVDLLKGRYQTNPFQEKLLCDCPKSRMIREHVRLPLLYYRQINTSLHLLQQTVHKSREFTECQIAIVSTSRNQFGEIVCN